MAKRSLQEQLQPIWEQNREDKWEEEDQKDVIEYVVITQGPVYHKAENLKHAKDIAAEVNGKIWAAIEDNGVYTTLYPVT